MKKRFSISSQSFFEEESKKRAFFWILSPGSTSIPVVSKHRHFSTPKYSRRRKNVPEKKERRIARGCRARDRTMQCPGAGTRLESHRGQKTHGIIRERERANIARKKIGRGKVRQRGKERREATNLSRAS